MLVQELWLEEDEEIKSIFFSTRNFIFEALTPRGSMADSTVKNVYMIKSIGKR